MKRTKTEYNRRYRAGQARWYIANRERILEERKAYRKANRAYINKIHREVYYKRHRKKKMMKTYGMTSEEYDFLSVLKNCQC